jgi:sec-independent protein translocase protein TatA
MPDIGPLELVIVLIIAIVVVGPKKLPQLGRSLGSGMREFKDSVSGVSKPEPTQATELPVATHDPLASPSVHENEPVH